MAEEFISSKILNNDIVLNVREFIKILLRTNFSYFLKIRNHTIYNFDYDEESNKLLLLTDENHNFLLNSSKINSIPDFINKLLDVNLDAEVYYNNYKVLTVYQNSFLRIVSIIVNNKEYNEFDYSSDVFKLFTDEKGYYEKLLTSITGISILKNFNTDVQHRSWDDLLDN